MIGQTLAMEGVFAFFLESSFLGLFLFGERELGQTKHFIGAGIATSVIRPGIWDNFIHFPLGFLLPLLGFLGIIGMIYFNMTGQDVRAFVSSSVFIAGMLGATAFGLYPVLLPASTDPAYSLTVHNAAAKPYALNVGLHLWIIGVLLALGYGTYLHIAFRGKVAAPIAEEGY